MAHASGKAREHAHGTQSGKVRVHSCNSRSGKDPRCSTNLRVPRYLPWQMAHRVHVLICIMVELCFVRVLQLSLMAPDTK